MFRTSLKAQYDLGICRELEATDRLSWGFSWRAVLHKMYSST